MTRFLRKIARTILSHSGNRLLSSLKLDRTHEIEKVVAAAFVRLYDELLIYIAGSKQKISLQD